MINHFTFNGTSTAQLGLIVSGVSIFGAGSRKVEKARIPGRNGDLQIELGGFNNYTVRYTVSITKNFTTTAQQIREWLLESKGYCDLTDTYHPDEIRKACFNSDIEFTTSMLYKYGQASIQFDCLPERYLTTNTPITTTATADTTTDTTMSLSTVPTPLNISLNGNTTQEGSSGKNLIPRPYYQTDGTYQGVTWTTDNMGKITASGTTTAGTNFLLTDNSNFSLRAGTYTLSVTGTLIGLDLKIYNGSAILATIANGSVNGKITFTLSTAQNIRTYFNTGYSNVSVNFSVYVQLEKGSTATAYEPHISPTNPQVIHNVSGDNIVNVTGFNLWDEQWELGYYGLNGAKRNSPNCIRSVNAINVLPNTAYYLCYTNSWGVSICLRFYDKYNNFISNGGQPSYPKGIITTPNNASYMRFYMADAYGTTYKHDICINVSDTQKNGTYEPYTRQSYPLYLPVENLLQLTQSSGTVSGVTVTRNQDGSWTLNGTATENFFYLVGNTEVLPNGTNYMLSGCPEGGNTTNGYSLQLTDFPVVYRKGFDVGDGYTFTSTGISYAVRLYIKSGAVLNNIVFKPQIEKGSHANQYNPYGNPSIELNKIGTYQDYIYKDGGKWYVHKAITKVDLGTLDSWNSYNDTFYANLVGAIIPSSGIASILCTSYRATSMASVISKLEDKAIALNTGQSRCNVYDSSYTASTIGNFINSVKGVWLYYPLATPTNTEITDTTLINQLNNIEKAYSYNGTTNILQVSNDNGFMLEVVSLHGSTFNSNYKGEPIITVNATGLIYLNGEVMEVLSAPVTINCQTMQCYNGVVNMNNEVRVNDFPEIKIGVNEIGSSMALTITPNNWRH